MVRRAIDSIESIHSIPLTFNRLSSMLTLLSFIFFHSTPSQVPRASLPRCRLQIDRSRSPRSRLLFSLTRLRSRNVNVYQGFTCSSTRRQPKRRLPSWEKTLKERKKRNLHLGPQFRRFGRNLLRSHVSKLSQRFYRRSR